MKINFNSDSDSPSVTITLANGCTIRQDRHPETNEPVTEANHEVVARACVTPADWQGYLKLKGVEIEGVMCSATKEDMWGLNSLYTNYRIAGQAFQPTRFDFANGNSLVITKNNIDAFMAAWLPFRQGFFTAA